MSSACNLALGIPLLCRVPHRGYSAKPFGFYPIRPHTYSHTLTHTRTPCRAAGPPPPPRVVRPPSATQPPPPAAGPPPSAAAGRPPPPVPRLPVPPPLAPAILVRRPLAAPGATPLPLPHGGPATRRPCFPASAAGDKTRPSRHRCYSYLRATGGGRRSSEPFSPYQDS